MTLTFLGAAHEVTGSCTLLTVGDHRILIDCGMEQGADTYQNADLPVAPSQIDCVLLTHAHLDHSGKLPLLAANGFTGAIYATHATARLCRIMLLDSAHIQEIDAEWHTRKAKRAGRDPVAPLYTAQDVERTLPLFTPLGYGEPTEILPGVSIRFIDAGHLLGSASIEVTATEQGEPTTLLFSGDLGNVNRPLIRDPQMPDAADIVVIESTYGDRLHPPRTDYVTQVAAVLQTTFDRGGNVLIPAFAVGRTQELLYCLRQIKNQHRVHGHDGFPVYVDSPLAVEATGIYSDDAMRDYYDDETLALLECGENPLDFPDLTLSITSDDSKRINEDPRPKVILSASGMCEAGRIRHHLKHNLWRAESTVLFVGYQAEGTLGRILQCGVPQVKLFGEEISVRAQLETMQGISGHADRDMLLEWLGSLKRPPRRVFVNHGQDAVCGAFAKTVRDRLGFDATAPYPGGEYDLATGACLSEGNRDRLRKVQGEPSHRAWDRLWAAGQRLLAVIEQNRHGANKDLGKFADQITALSNKWRRDDR